MSEKRQKILIADDMETFLRLEKMLLERSGYEIIMAKSGSEAIKKIQTERPSLIFLDFLMPDMNGDVVCRFVKTNKNLKHIPVIMVTTKGEPEFRERCTQAGADDFITKPVTQRDLFDKINLYLRVNRRKHKRASLRVTVKASGESFTFTEFTYDISEGGIFVETEKPLDPGIDVELAFALPEEASEVIAQARTVRSVPPEVTAPGKCSGMGIEFTSVTAADKARIKSYVDKNA